MRIQVMNKSEIVQSSFLVFGAAKSGIAAAILLNRHGVKVAIVDEKALSAPAEISSAGIQFISGKSDYGVLDGRTAMVLSPGIPQSHDLVREAQKRGMRVISEIELASAFASAAATTIAITGTNGKTTTTAWIAHILATAGRNAVAGGNIGDAWSNSADQPQNASDETVFVIEASSFQLETIQDFRPDIAVLTNLAPDHLDRYDTYADYVAAKRNIIRNMTSEQALILNADNEDSQDFPGTSPVRVYRFSAHRDPSGPSAFLRDSQMLIRDWNGTEHFIFSAAELPLPGMHNIENALAASLASFLAGASPEAIARGLKTFRGVEHRIEFCGEMRGVRFYNDSKATNVDSLEKALQSFSQPIVLIAGGKDKHSNYGSISELVKQSVKQLITIGEAAPLIEAAWKDIVPATRAGSMENAVQLASEKAAAGDIVLLSPACASYDMYNNFEERGRDFKQCVAQLLERESCS
jgi:UDP-N-acetylmuramoylalanine--D-glutamate ligase